MNTSSRDHDHTAGAVLEHEFDARAQEVVAHLDKVQQRELRKDTGHGYQSAREVGQVVGLPPSEARALLASLAEAGRVRRLDAANGLFWRSINPLPWESGGTLERERAHERELWAEELTLIVQAVWTERGQTMSRDVKAYPAGLRQRAEAHVSLENSKSQSRRGDDRWNDRHLRAGYTPPPSYRLVALSSPEQVTGEGSREEP